METLNHLTFQQSFYKFNEKSLEIEISENLTVIEFLQEILYIRNPVKSKIIWDSITNFIFLTFILEKFIIIQLNINLGYE